MQIATVNKSEPSQPQRQPTNQTFLKPPMLPLEHSVVLPGLLDSILIIGGECLLQLQPS